MRAYDLITATDRIRELESALANNWQLIETAPKDGTVILGFMRWELLYDGRYETFIGQTHWADINCGGWVSWCPGKPTHWQPLPLPPATTQKES